MLDKQETGNSSHFSKAMREDKQGSVITGPTSLPSRFTGGPVVTIPFFCWKVLHPPLSQGINALCWKEDIQPSLASRGVSQNGKRRIFSFKQALLEALTTEWSPGFRHKNFIHLQDASQSVSQILLNQTSEIKHDLSLQTWFFTICQ